MRLTTIPTIERGGIGVHGRDMHQIARITCPGIGQVRVAYRINGISRPADGYVRHVHSGHQVGPAGASVPGRRPAPAYG